MSEFLQVPITSDATQLADDAVQRLRDQWAGWDPNDADLEIIQIEALAPMAQNAAEVAARIPGSIFRQLGTDIYGVAYSTGAPATGITTWTLEDTDGHTIPAGSQIDVDGYVFSTETDVTILPGSDTATGVAIVATETGTAGNGLTGISVAPISALDWVAAIALTGTTANGEDAEDDATYNSRFSQRLQLQARTLVTLRDHELFALDYAGVGRAYAYKPDPAFPRDVKVVLTDDVGDPVDTAIKATVLADMTDDTTTRRVNSTVTLGDATYTTINVTWTAAFYPGTTASDVIARVNTALTDFLSPANWGQPTIGTIGTVVNRWYNDKVVRYEKVIGVIEAVPGVDYLATLSLNGGGEGVDVTMTGVVALPEAGTISGTEA